MTQKGQQTKTKKTSIQQKNQNNIYNSTILTRKIPIHITFIGDNIVEILEKAISSQIEGKCIAEGYVKTNSVNLTTYSSGILNADYVIFTVLFECMICMPVEGMQLKCYAKNITKAGIRAEISELPNPLIIFIARDHYYASPYFANVKENDEIIVKVIGQRFELNDKYISIIAELLEPIGN